MGLHIAVLATGGVRVTKNIIQPVDCHKRVSGENEEIEVVSNRH